MLQVGSKFPEFSLPNQNNETKTLKDYAGNWLVVYVYPKDDTPGCTIQGKSFTATKEDYEREGVTVIGVNQDDVDSHKSFCDKYSFAIDLLSDKDGELLKALDVTQSEHKGNMYWDRTTFVVDPKGVLVKVCEKVKPEGHERVLLSEIRDLQKAGAAPAR